MRINYSSLRKWVVSSIVVVGLLCFAGAIAGLYVLAPALHRIARTRTEEYLRERFKSSVQFTDFHVSVYPRIHLIIDGLVMRHEGRTDIPPLIQINTITIDANLASFFAARPVISHVTLDGLHINTPPHQPGGKPMIHGIAGRSVREISGYDREDYRGRGPSRDSAQRHEAAS